MPSFKAIRFEPPKFAEKAKKAPRVDPEAGLPWRMFAAYGTRLCKQCGMQRPAAFVIAKSRESAGRVFTAGNGLCPTCMCSVLLNPWQRIVVTDAGTPNPGISTLVSPGGEALSGAPVLMSAGKRSVSPYRLWALARNKPKKCACGGMRSQFYVIAADFVAAQKRVERYGMCALCMCEYLTLDRFQFETTDGGAP